MKVLNQHCRRVPVSTEAAGKLLDTLASRHDALWASERWPPMILDGPLGVGARGGHGPIRYFVEEFFPGRSVVFRFTGPRGFHGTHEFSIVPEGDGCEIRHVIDMRTSGPALLSWPLIFRPLHDALLEDSLDKAEATLAGTEWRMRPLSVWVRMLRAVLGRRGRRAQRRK